MVLNLSWSEILFSTSPIFILQTVLVTSPLKSGILFLTFSIFILEEVLVTNPLTSAILF